MRNRYGSHAHNACMRFGLRSTVEFMQPNSAAISALAEPSRLASTVTGGECVVVKIIPVFKPLR
jgi:hypothetical protein